MNLMALLILLAIGMAMVGKFQVTAIYSQHG